MTTRVKRRDSSSLDISRRVIGCTRATAVKSNELSNFATQVTEFPSLAKRTGTHRLHEQVV